MKKLLLCISILFVSIAFSQNADEIYMIAKDGDFYYQRIVECPRKTANEIHLLIKQSGAIKFASQILVDDTTRIVANLSDLPSHTEDLKGYSFMSTPNVIGHFTLYKGRVIYEIKNGKYRVTFSDIQWKVKDGGDIWGEYSEIKRGVFNKKNKVRAQYTDKIAYALTYTFNTELAPTENKFINNDW